MKRFTLVILTLFLILINTPVMAAQSYVKKNLAVIAEDGFNLKATLTYPKIKSKTNFQTVVLLHSHGTNSEWWGSVPDSLLENGYAVLAIDLRGHGASVYNSKLVKISWKNLTNNAYKKYPYDVMQVINYIRKEYPKINFFDEWAIIGSDIGGCAGIIASDKLDIKPETIIFLSPVVKTKGLYIPISIAQLTDVDFLSISGADDKTSIESEQYLKRFAQNKFSVYTSQSKSSGMVLLKNDLEIPQIMLEWINQYLKN